ncbi:NADPH-dependent 7-cyano-7-deazaguanine reductase QueF [bacterium SCSIO 12696]|nr:NADPH-dependent 7-cyano-7-deazaguanine reductase QueF [bacterium SCSIO 12696]
MADLHLGKHTQYPSEYDASLLTPIPRSEGRKQLEFAEVPFVGADLWTGYELSWLDDSGKPQVAVAEFTVPANSAALIESKSFKLYLNSFNQTRFTRWGEVSQRLEVDLSQCAGGPVLVQLFTLANYQKLGVADLPGTCIDNLDVAIDCYHPDPSLLDVTDVGEVQETLHSHLLKTNCPVTDQPDWASVMVRYRGRQISREGLLKYLISFRQHQDFHEQCVERIFMDILSRCGPDELDVYARYTRRGGLDINPWRSTSNATPTSFRLVRQ